MADEIVSKTKRKQEMLELQALGAALVELPESQLDFLERDLRDAVLEAKRISSHEARRRQLQYIGRLMREVDPAPIRAKLDELTGTSTQANAQHKRLEALRARLLADDEALEHFAATHPSADLPTLRALVRNSRREREEGRPPRAYRELFRLLKSIESAPPAS
ncbi:MAG TPA: ribosome biogenesis factor YjgA [Burkholderiales bacterium]